MALPTDTLPFTAEIFAKTMLEPLFYFAMARTHDENEAAELVSDIAESVLTALSRGTVPEHPHGWVWRIAKNRYARYAAERMYRRESTFSLSMEEDGAFSQYDIPDAAPSPEEQLILEEDLAALRRTLAYIRSDWRQVLVAYYLEDKPIRQIASELSIPEGTVKTRLYQSRNYLKEGIYMARTFGKLSWAPENVNFSMSGYSSDERPWNIITHKLYKNILLAAYRTPSTAEELALEMGIALPYMEDELEFLVRESLLRKNGDKYETGFMILSADAQDKMQENLLKITPKITELLTQAIEAEMFSDYTKDIAWHDGCIPEEEIRWVLLMREVDYIGWETYSKGEPNSSDLPERPSGRWNLLGFETLTNADIAFDGDIPFVGQHGAMDGAGKRYIWFSQYKFNWHGITNRTPLHLRYAETETLEAICLGKDLTGVPEEHLTTLTDAGYIVQDGETYRPSLFVFRRKAREDALAQKKAADPEGYAAWEKTWRAPEAEAIALMQSYTDFCRGIIAAEVPDFLKDDRFQQDFALSNGTNLRGAVFLEALKTGYISYDPEKTSQSAGAFINL